MPRMQRSSTRRFSRSRGRPRFNRRWIGTVVEGTQAANTFNASELVVPADYQIGNLAAEATLMTIYAHVLITNVSAASASVTAAVWGLGVFDADIPVGNGLHDPDTAASLTDERWLMTDRYVVPTGERGNGHFSYHIKQKVKLHDSAIRFVTSNSDALTGYEYYCDFRILLATR